MKPAKPGLPRRTFIELSAKSTALLGLSAPLLTSACREAPATTTVHGACYHDCPDRCSWQVTVSGQQVIDFRATQNNPYTAGQLCNKMVNFPAEVTYHPDRLLHPLKRTGAKGSGQFTRISWEQAISEVAGRLQDIIAAHGGEAILPYSFGGNQGLVQGGAISDRFFAHIGASRLERTICGDPAVAGVLATNGQTTGLMPEDIVHSRFIVLWGTNTLRSNQHLWPFILQARDRGARLVVIDPFRSETAEAADWHLQPLPGTDTALALGVIHVLLAEGLHDADYIARYTVGIEELTRHVQAYDPATVAQLTGLEAATITDFARAYAQGEPSLIRVLIGMEHQANGASAFRTVAMLPALTGAWRSYGGGLMHMHYELFGEALRWEAVSLPESLANRPTRSINMVRLGRALTDPDLHPAIRALVVFNANPAVTTPHQNLVMEGLQREDLLTVVSEHFMTDTARFADYIFPATSALEHWDILDSWGTPYLNINEPAISPLGASKPNSELFRLLARAMDLDAPYLYVGDQALVAGTLESDHPYMQGITLASLRQQGGQRLHLPEKWMPHAEGNFKTASGKCQLYDPAMDPPLPEYVPVQYSAEELARYPLQLLSIKTPKHFLNSSHAQLRESLALEGSPRLDIHAVDAAAREIADGDEIRVYNGRGRVLLTARVSTKVRPGVVCMPQGHWPSLMAGGSSANALTTDRLTDMGDGSALQETKVEVAKV